MDPGAFKYAYRVMCVIGLVIVVVVFCIGLLLGKCF